FFQTFTPACGASVCVDYHFAWSHGDYTPEIGQTWLGFVGPGVKASGKDGSVWTDHTDARPTMLLLLGLEDDYVDDGRVIVEGLRPGVLPRSLKENRDTYLDVARTYKQLNAPYGTFAAHAIKASTRALASGSATDDSRYQSIESRLESLTADRDDTAASMRTFLHDIAFGGGGAQGAQSRIDEANALLKQVADVAGR